MSAIEFALVAPVLIIFYIGMTEMCQGFMAQKRMGHVSAIVADMVTQQKTVSISNLNEILGVGEVIMKPFPTASLHQRVSSVSRLNGVDTVNWTLNDGIEEDPTFTVPADMIGNNQSVIVTEVTYRYNSPASLFLKDGIKFRQVYFLLPRHVDLIPCTDCSVPG
ncbi:MAG: TadE/TadG family type IV pilus assembly protein [Pseudomonadota bacterium]|nr:TadE/TadG family type IV pilus assembly protein [Pseudomonadota bacterium]